MPSSASCGVPVPRKKQLRSNRVLHVDEARALRRKIAAIVVRAQCDGDVPRMPSDVQWQVVNDLTFAALAAQGGIRGVVSGSRAKPDARASEIFVWECARALIRAGVRITKQQDPGLQNLARKMAVKLRLPGTGSLNTVMRRASKIQSYGIPDDSAATAWLDGRMEVVREE